MFWRIVTPLLIPTLLFQGMAYCHFQWDSLLEGHAQETELPHIHLSSIGLSNRPNDPYFQQTGRTGQFPEQQTPIQDHDADAVYVSELLMLGGHSSYSLDFTADLWIPALIDALIPCTLKTLHLAGFANSPHSSSSHHCPLYLRIHLLLI